ncbi:MAG: hypothetical protein IMY73_02095 [Bacteroidetes bacterium]|nr:hypothetical protein [Bacteroidota bacterium]
MKFNIRKIKIKHLIVFGMIKKAFIIATILFLNSSCVKQSDFVLNSYNGMKIKSASLSEIGVDLKFSATNNSCATLKIKESYVELFTGNNQPICKVYIEEPIKIVKGTSDYRLPIRVEVRGGVLGASRIFKYLNKKPNDIYANGTLKFRHGIISRKKTIENLPIGYFQNVLKQLETK